MTLNNAIKRIGAHPQILILIVMIIVLSIALPSFFTGENFLNIFKNMSTVAIITSGIAVVLIGGNFDLSVGSMFSLLCAVGILSQHINTFMAVLMPLVVALALGLLNGMLIYKFKISSIIVTLGTMAIFQGLTLIISKSSSVPAIPGTSYENIAGLRFFSIPAYIFVFIILAVVCEIALRKTKFGRGLYYMGVNREASMIAGHNEGVYIIISYMLSGTTVAIAAIIQSSRMLTANPIVGTGLEIEVLTAVLIGGISLLGGRGNVIQAIVGAMILAVIINGLNLFGAPSEIQNIVKGALILTAIILNARANKNDEI